MASSNGNVVGVTGLCAGNSTVTAVDSPHKGQWREALMFSLICALNKRMNLQSWGWCFDTPSCSLWRHCNFSHNLFRLSFPHIDGLVQDCIISSALAMEILQSCTKPSIYCALLEPDNHNCDYCVWRTNSRLSWIKYINHCTLKLVLNETFAITFQQHLVNICFFL